MPNIAANPRLNASKSHESRRNGAVYRLTRIQDVLMDKLSSDSLTVTEVERLTRGYVEAEKLKRTIKGLPANTSQSIREPKQPKRKPQASGPIEELAPPEK